MDISKILSLIKLPAKNITSGTFDGFYFYFVSPNYEKVLKLNYKEMKFTTISLNESYTFLTYDSKDKVFFAIDNNTDKNLFILDKNFKTKGKISLNLKFENDFDITAISYDCHENLIILSSTDIDICINTHGDICHSNIACDDYISTLKTDNSTTILYNNSGTFYLDLYFADKFIDSFSLTSEIKYPISILSANCYEKLNTIIITLLTKDCDANYFLSHILINISCYKDIISPNDCNNNHSTKCNNSNNDIIESIALIETSLSHILNAEGEKIQKGIKLSKSISDLICINKSVNTTLIHIISLENILYEKLISILENNSCRPSNYSTNINHKCLETKNYGDKL